MILKVYTQNNNQKYNVTQNYTNTQSLVHVYMGWISEYDFNMTDAVDQEAKEQGWEYQEPLKYLRIVTAVHCRLDFRIAPWRCMPLRYSGKNFW